MSTEFENFFFSYGPPSFYSPPSYNDNYDTSTSIYGPWDSSGHADVDGHEEEEEDDDDDDYYDYTNEEEQVWGTKVLLLYSSRTGVPNC